MALNKQCLKFPLAAVKKSSKPGLRHSGWPARLTLVGRA
jgi:hypothetical protein